MRLPQSSLLNKSVDLHTSMKRWRCLCISRIYSHIRYYNLQLENKGWIELIKLFMDSKKKRKERISSEVRLIFYINVTKLNSVTITTAKDMTRDNEKLSKESVQGGVDINKWDEVIKEARSEKRALNKKTKQHQTKLMEIDKRSVSIFVKSSLHLPLLRFEKARKSTRLLGSTVRAGTARRVAFATILIRDPGKSLFNMHSATGPSCSGKSLLIKFHQL